MPKANRCKKRAVFLDRDGVINLPPKHRFIRHWDEFRFIPGTLAAIRRMTVRKIALVIISNQSGVGRRIMSRARLEEIHRRMMAAVRRHGGKILAAYYCTHHPDRRCGCRKPKTGMLTKAAREHGIDLNRSIVVGDRETDILMAHAAGCRSALVLSGKHDRKSASRLAVRPDKIFPDLSRTVPWILKEMQKKPSAAIPTPGRPA
ncbi:MAG: HAD family hydrolase [Candidatus Omnitrophica bacterium]|nr:HAD family hydrolase [Candidatus Omnitrophota bacterium]